MKFTIIKSCLARFSGTFAVGTPSNIHGTALSYRCAKFGAFVNSVTILTLRDLTNSGDDARKWNTREKLAGREERKKGGDLLPFYFRVRAFSIQRTRLSRSLEKAMILGER